MRSSSRLSAANAIEDPGRVLESFLSSKSISSIVEQTHVDWSAGVLLTTPPEMHDVLRRLRGLSGDGITLTAPGLSLLGKLQIDLEAAARSSFLAEIFDIQGVLAKGGSSVAFKAVNTRVGRTVVLKVLRPSRPDQAESAIKKLGSLETIPHLVAPIDSHKISVKSVAGDPVSLYCIVFPYIPGTTLEKYLQDKTPVSPFFFEALFRQVGGVLERLESLGMNHGDLHGSNILVRNEDLTLEFVVIDPSAGLTAASPYVKPASDFEWFKLHITRSILALQRHLTSMSIEKHLGPRLFSVVNAIQQSNSMAFRDMLKLLDVNPRYDRWLRERQLFIAKRFKAPKPLGLLRWEEIADPAQALDLFEPYAELFDRMRTFGNSLLVGARGSGKSTYLAALAYFPGAKKRLVDCGEIFGVLFSCRQGEFKHLSKDFLSFGPKARVAVKRVLVLKIIRRLLAILASANDIGELSPSGDLSVLYEFVRQHMRDKASIPSLSSTPSAALSNLASGVVRWEELEIARLFRKGDSDESDFRQPLDEAALLKFCELVRSQYPALATAQFYFLFDDAGEPNIPHEAQHVLNDLLTSSNPVFCMKLSAERFSYDLRDAAGKTLEETHDFTSFDIASAYATESGFDHARAAIKEYFQNIMKRRLEHWSYSSSDIAAYLGDQLKGSGEVPPVRDLVRRLSASRKDAYYSGWEVVWQLADKTARNLIELVSEIFANAHVLPTDGVTEKRSPPTVIKARIQDRAIRAVSNRRLRGLEFIPGAIELGTQRAPLGKHLYLCASSFGLVSNRYLTASRDGGRLDERLAIERNDTRALAGDAQVVLQLLVRYGIFDDSILNIARDDRQKKPVYVFNRIFCPAFSISFRRDTHLRLSTGKFEMYLLSPSRFAAEGTEFLRNAAVRFTEPKFWSEDDEDS
jgi:hypothetical protein